MPNHVSTILEVTGTPKDIDEFIKKAAREYENGEKVIFSFGSFDPCPPELHDVSSPVTIVSQDDYDKAVAKRNEQIKNNKDTDFILALPLTAELQATYLAHHGADNWYDWQVKNWGTKWDCYDQSQEWEITENPNDDMQKTIKCFYMTAWSPATKALSTISSMYPNLSFKHSFADEGGGFIGYQVFEDGEGVEEVDYEWDSEDAKDLRLKLGMGHYDEENNQEEE